jgi:hypothetical protein
VYFKTVGKHQVLKNSFVRAQSADEIEIHFKFPLDAGYIKISTLPYLLNLIILGGQST